MDIRVKPDDTARRLREYVRNHPELIYDEYKPEQNHSLEGACYLLAECYFHARGGTDSGLTIYCLSWDDVTDHDTSATHWFLRDDATVVDLGLDYCEQGAMIPYHTARRRAFMTGYTPSKRTQDVLDTLDLS